MTHIMSGVLLILFTGVFLVLTGRFLYIQAAGEIDNVSLDEWAKEKRTSSYNLPAERGKILDRNGMTLAYDRPTFRLLAALDDRYTGNSKEPMHVTNPEKTAEMLAPFLDMEKSEVLEILQKGINENRYQVEFGTSGRELSQQTKDEIGKLELPGISFQKEAIRYYPNGMFASRIIGFARKDADQKITGVTGIESQMNDLLGGKDGRISYERDKYDFKLLRPDEVIKEAKDGANVYLTLDQKIQTLLEDVMTRTEEAYKPKRMTAVVMDPKTGEILAMSNRPSYNPNNPKEVQNWYNDVISTPFEPGSTMKMFTWAAAVEEDVYNGDEWYESGKYQVNKKVSPINDWKTTWGSITFDEGFKRSSNVAAAKLVWEKIGPEKYLDYLKAFDFDKTTGIDLPGEIAGKIVYNYPRDKMTTAFGQASTITPIQQMKAATAIANNGKMMKPYVVSKMIDPASGKVIKENTPEVAGEPISKDTSKKMRDLLGKVVNTENGTGLVYKLDDYTVAGKTGTAQIPNPDGGYLEGAENYVFSFLGMAPRKDPQLMMYVSITQPELDDLEAGSVPISNIFKNVMKNSLQYLNIEPDKGQTNVIKPVEIPEMIGKNTAEIEKELTEKGLNITIIGSGDIVMNASAAKGNELFPNDRLILLTKNSAMPDITGWSVRDVLKLSELAELKVEKLGNGYAISQSIKESARIKAGDKLVVEFKVPNNEKNSKKNNDAKNADEKRQLQE